MNSRSRVNYLPITEIGTRTTKYRTYSFTTFKLPQRFHSTFGMSKPDIDPKQSASGIAVDPKTLERVIPESRRPDGSVRKQLKVRPGFTPQEDVSRFRGSRQQQFDRNQLPRGHILGWIAPSLESKRVTPGAGASGADAGDGKPLTKSAAKNAKRKAKKQSEKEKIIRESWEDSDEEKSAKADAAVKQPTEEKDDDSSRAGEQKSATANAPTEAPATASTDGNALAEELEKKLDVH